MQKRINRLKKIEADTIKEAEKRDDKFLKRSEKWQNSPAGKLFDHQTAKLADIVESLRETIKVMESFIQ